MKRIVVITLFLFLAFSYSRKILNGERYKDHNSQKKDVTSIEIALFEFVNKEREKHGLSSLKFSLELGLQARKHSQDMASSQNLSHISSSGKSYQERIVEAGFYFISAGENIAKSDTFVPEFIHQSLMESPEHRETILHPAYNEVGIGVFFKADKGYYITQDFLQAIEPKKEEEVKSEIQEKINRLRLRNFLFPLRFEEEADEYAYEYSLNKAEKKPLPPLPQPFLLVENHILFLATPSLDETYSTYKDIILDKMYERAGLGVRFYRSKEYPGGAYFITLILFPTSKNRELSKKDLREIVLKTINEIREKRGFNVLRISERLTRAAENIARRNMTQKIDKLSSFPKFWNWAVFSFVTESLQLLPEILSEKMAGISIPSKKTGIGIIFGKNQKFPRGAFWVSIIFEE